MAPSGYDGAINDRKQEVAVVPTETLAKLSLFEGLPEGALKAIGAISRELPFAADTVIFSPETPAEHLYVLLEGSVRLTVHVSTLSGPVTVTVLGTPGQAFGFSSLLGSGHHNSSAESGTIARVVAVRGRELMDFLAKEPDVGFALMKRVAQRISNRLAALRRLLVETIIDYERQDSATADN
jgi:CRP-like cAMP-binding protein